MYLCSTQLALSVDHDSYAFIFGFNTFIALAMQSVLTIVVADERGLDLGVRTQVTMCSRVSEMRGIVSNFSAVVKERLLPYLVYLCR